MLHLPYSRVYVSISVTFHDGIGFLDHRPPCGIGWNLLASSTCPQEPHTGFPRSESSFVAALGWYCTPGYFLCEDEVYSQLVFLRMKSRAHSPFTDTILVRLINPREPVLFLRRFKHTFLA